ncbi:MFS transporter [Intrasporangium sp.]|uniref:MFS transporter n=1 Tax=Intrasporangium sp. TaxID=1925024 RepID=UPI003221B2BC
MTTTDRPALLKVSVGATLLILVLAEVVAAFETTMAIQLLYSPGDFFTTDLALLVWIVTAYSLVGALATGFVGRLGDQLGRRKVLIGVLALSALGSLISALAPNFGVLVLGRALQGVSAAVLPLCFGIIRATFPSARVATGIAVVGTSALLAGAGGMLIGGLFLDHASWHYIFWSAAAFAAIVAVLGAVFLPREPRESLARASRVDYVGGLLFGGSVAAALYGLTISKERGWTDSMVLLLIVGGLVGLAVWVAWELRVTAPMIDVRMFRNRKFSLGMLATALIAVGPVGMTNIIVITLYRTPSMIPVPGGDPINLPVGLGLSATMAGVLGFVTAGASFATAPIIGRISTRYGARTGLIIGSAMMIIGMLVVAVAPTSLTVVISGIIVVVLATGFLYPGMPMVIVECVRPEETSAATGVNAVTRTAFMAVAASLVAILLSVAPITLGEHGFTSRTGLNVALGACILACLATIVVAALIPGGGAEKDAATGPSGRPTRTPEVTRPEVTRPDHATSAVTEPA